MSAEVKTSGKNKAKATVSGTKDTEVLYVTRDRAFDMRVSGYSHSQKLTDGRLVFRFLKTDMDRLKRHYRLRTGELVPYKEK